MRNPSNRDSGARDWNTPSHPGFETVGPELCKAGTDSKQFARSYKLQPRGQTTRRSCGRYPSFRMGRTVTGVGWFLLRFQGPSTARSPPHEPLIDITRVIVGAPSDQQRSRKLSPRERRQVKRDVSHLPAISAATTECRGPYSGMRAPSRPSDHIQIASAGCFLIFTRSARPSKHGCWLAGARDSQANATPRNRIVGSVGPFSCSRHTAHSISDRGPAARWR